MAKGWLEAMVANSEWGTTGQIHIDSAGVNAGDGFGANQMTIDVMNEKDVDVSFHLTKRFTEVLIDQANLILVMEPFHREEILKLNPRAAERTFLLTSFGQDASIAQVDSGIEDPIGQSIEVYQRTRDAIHEAVLPVIPWIRDQLVAVDC